MSTRITPSPSRVFITAALAVLAIIAAPAKGAAQIAPSTAPVEAQAQAAPAQPATGFQDGFFIQDASGENRLLFGMIVHIDGRFSVDDPTPIINTFTIRKVRPTFSGRIAKYFDFKVMPDFGNGTVVVQDAYLDIRFAPGFRIRTGKDKTPVGYELLIGDAYLLFPERSLASSLVPNRDVGVAVQGDVAGNRLFYAAGVFNGIPDGTSTTTELDTNNGKDLAGRIVINPFRSAQAANRPANGLGFQIGGSAGNEDGALPSFRTSVGQTYFSYVSGAFADGKRTRVTPAVFYYYKAFGGFAEWMQSSQAVTRNAVRTSVTNHAWDVTVSYFLTGETASAGITRPRHNFDPAKGAWGAVQLLARYTALAVDEAVFNAGLAAAGASREARSFTIGMNWYANPYVKYYATFERTTFDKNTGTRPAENVILFRVQLGF